MTDIAATWPGDVRFALYELMQRVLPVMMRVPPPIGWSGSVEALAKFAAGVPPAPAPSWYGELVQRLALTPTEELVLIAALSPDLDIRMISMWQVLGHRIDVMRPRLQSVVQLASTAEELRDVLSVAGPAHVLRAFGLVTLRRDPGVAMLDGVVEPQSLAAIAGRDDGDAHSLGIRREPRLGSFEPIPAALRGPLAMARLGRTRTGERPWAIWVDGPAGSGRGYLARSLAAATGRGTAWLVIDRERFDIEAAFATLLRVAVVEQLVPCVELAVDLDLARLLAPIAELYAGPLFLVAETRSLLPPPWHTITTSAFRPDITRRRQLWQLALPELDDERRDEIAQRYPLTVGGVFRAADEAQARDDGPPTQPILAQAAREQLEARSTLAERSRSTKRLGDLVATLQTLALIHEIIAFARNRRQVFDDWGFARRMRGGLKVLFSGPPGTGKTLSAEIISGELGLDLYRIDLSNVVSKWIGETEKNLKQVFDQAEAHGGVLLFDEADALFGKRTSDVKSSTDRYANLEVNYLLQRMEAYDGIVLLTTNLETGIDEAFRRRLNFRVRFLAPDAEERERLWQLMIPDTVPLGEQLDFAEVAERFDMAGGNIKNAALRAAILAAAEGTSLMTAHLITAGEREFSEIGRIGK